MTGATETVLLLACPVSFVARLRVESFAAAICEVVNRSGAEAFAQWTNVALRIRIQGFPEPSLTELLDGFLQLAEHVALELELVRRGVPATQLPDPRGLIPWGSVLTGELRPSILRRLPEGCCLVTAVPHDDGIMPHAELVGPAKTRGALWRRLTRTKAAGRSWRVIWNEVDLGGALTANGQLLNIGKRPDRP